MKNINNLLKGEQRGDQEKGNLAVKCKQLYFGVNIFNIKLRKERYKGNTDI